MPEVARYGQKQVDHEYAQAITDPMLTAAREHGQKKSQAVYRSGADKQRQSRGQQSPSVNIAGKEAECYEGAHYSEKNNSE